MKSIPSCIIFNYCRLKLYLIELLCLRFIISLTGGSPCYLLVIFSPDYFIYLIPILKAFL